MKDFNIANDKILESNLTKIKTQNQIIEKVTNINESEI